MAHFFFEPIERLLNQNWALAPLQPRADPLPYRWEERTKGCRVGSFFSSCNAPARSMTTLQRAVGRTSDLAQACLCDTRACVYSSPYPCPAERLRDLRIIHDVCWEPPTLVCAGGTQHIRNMPILASKAYSTEFSKYIRTSPRTQHQYIVLRHCPPNPKKKCFFRGSFQGAEKEISALSFETIV